MSASHSEAFLSRFKVKDLVHQQQDVIRATEDTTVEDAMNLLKKHNVLSLPIYDTTKHAYVGVINLFDLVTAVAFQNIFESYDDHKLDDISEQVFTQCQKMEIFQTPVISLLGVSEESTTMWSFDEDDNLKDLLDVFAKGVHRVLVRFHGKIQPLAPATPASPPGDRKNSDSYVRVLSQTDVIRFIHFNAHNSAVESTTEKTVASLGLLRRSEDNKQQAKYRSIVTLPCTSTALTGFQKLSLNDISGLAVVDADGKIVANLSTSDMRGITKDEFKNVLLPVSDYLKLKSDEIRPPVTCTAESKLIDVISDVLQNKVHRVWVVDADGKPIDVITLTDIINVFNPFLAQ